jgi:hypothetical protein
MAEESSTVLVADASAVVALVAAEASSRTAEDALSPALA